jgi:hypothetical protein
MSTPTVWRTKNPAALAGFYGVNLRPSGLYSAFPPLMS